MSQVLTQQKMIKGKRIKKLMMEYANPDWVRETGFDGKTNYYGFRAKLNEELQMLDQEKLLKVS
ncbi:MAG: hypothetical protein IH946_09960 [Bacteroidetes bacterium]|nr:hypothetical protein [Bacteroidota bacterium]